ncbi:MAG: hypothetical protein HKO92_10365 [Flavobacteriaceae bacterium]|nr:hypothetical protein [Flavobacteriaceae bacterium]
MKRIIKNSLLIVVFLTTIFGNANEAFILTKLRDNKTTMLTLLEVKEGSSLLIKDKSGVVLYREKIKSSGIYTKGFDFTSLPEGNYFFELDKDFEIPFKVIKTIKSNSSKISRSRRVNVDIEVENKILSLKGEYYSKYFLENNK